MVRCAIREGDGTTLLEGMLNGFETYGCDLNLLVAKIARAKTALLTVPRGVPTAQLFRMRLFGVLHRFEYSS